MAIPIWEMKSSRKPIAIIKGGDRRLHFYKINRFSDKMFATKDGLVFELDDRYEYRFRRTSIYIYNFANSKPLLLTGMEEIDTTLKRLGQAQLLNVDQYMDEMREMQRQIQMRDPKARLELIPRPPDITEQFQAPTQRFIQDYMSDDERSKTEMMIKVHKQKLPITKYSSELMGMGANSGDYAIVQVAHKKLDIVKMHVHDNRAYTQYGVFDFTLDNVYFVNKQAIAFFVLNSNEDETVKPLPKDIHKNMLTMIKQKRWNLLESYDPNNTLKNKFKTTKRKGKAFVIVPIATDENKEPELRLPELEHSEPLPEALNEIQDEDIDEEEGFEEEEIDDEIEDIEPVKEVKKAKPEPAYIPEPVIIEIAQATRPGG